jgi:Fic family protein
VEEAGEYVPIVWRGRRARAFVPAALRDRELPLSAVTVAQVARAQAALEHGAASLPPELAALARLLLRAEGVASSFIEGVRAPVVDVVLAERTLISPTPGNPITSSRANAEMSAGGWIAANLAAVTAAVAAASGPDPLTPEVLCAWHRTLMAGSPTPERYVGRFRDEQGWIGGSSPLDAHLVTPPPDRLDPLLVDLCAYVNGDIKEEHDPITRAAVAHAQFEVIHPFADGNGRIGRVLVAWILVRRLSLVVAPPVSTMIAADVGGYAAGLVWFQMNEHERWIRWFAEAVERAGVAQEQLVGAVESLSRSWRERLLRERAGARTLRSNAAAWRVLDLLPSYVIISARIIADELGVPMKTATAALRELADAGVLTDVGPAAGANDRGRPSRWFASNELLGLAGSTTLRS